MGSAANRLFISSIEKAAGNLKLFGRLHCVRVPRRTWPLDSNPLTLLGGVKDKEVEERNLKPASQLFVLRSLTETRNYPWSWLRPLCLLCFCVVKVSYHCITDVLHPFS